jgi:uncharacterized protein YbjT (DUF2867 family)
MVGRGVLRECLLDPSVERVLSVGRRSLGVADPKLEELVRPDLSDLSPVERLLTGHSACFFCLGMTSVGTPEAEYRRVTHDLTVSVATTLARLNPGMTIAYVSGAGTDRSGRRMWARVKGETEEALRAMPFRAVYLFRPGIIRPLHGIRSKTRAYRVGYLLLSPFLFVVRAVAPDAMTSTDAVGRAMIRTAADGAPTGVLGNREINRLGAPAARPAA